MTFRDEEFVRDRFRSLHKTPRTVLRALAARTDQSGVCWPSQALLADDTGLSRSTINRALAYLEEVGLIARIKRSSQSRGGRTSDLISVNLDDRLEFISYDEWLSTHRIGRPKKVDPKSHRDDPKSHPARSKVARCDSNQKKNQQEPTGYLPATPEVTSSSQASGYQQEEVTSSREQVSDRIVSQVAYAMAETVGDLDQDKLWDLYARIINADFQDQSPTLRKANEVLSKAVTQEVKTRYGLLPGGEADVR
jgi:DNA-binding transcriptional ArsR family regulator